jgi:hypothetical protein
LDHDH